MSWQFSVNEEGTLHVDPANHVEVPMGTFSVMLIAKGNPVGAYNTWGGGSGNSPGTY